MGHDSPPRLSGWLSPEEAAQLSGFSTKTIYRALWEGELVASRRRRRWRIRRAALDTWIDGERAADVPATTRMRGRPPARKGSLGSVLEALEGEAA